MFSELFAHKVNDVLTQKGNDVLEIQRVASVRYRQRSGAMNASFSQDIKVQGGHLSIDYPTHVRILD